MRNITIKKYASGKDTFYPLHFLEPKPFFGEFKTREQEITYEEMRVLIRLNNQKDTWDRVIKMFSIFYGCNQDSFWNKKILDFFPAANYLYDYLGKVVTAEKELIDYVSSDADPLWEASGAQALNKYGDIMPLFNIASHFQGIFPLDLKSKKYNEIFLSLKILANMDRVKKNYNQLKK